MLSFFVLLLLSRATWTAIILGLEFNDFFFKKNILVSNEYFIYIFAISNVFIFSHIPTFQLVLFSSNSELEMGVLHFPSSDTPIN